MPPKKKARGGDTATTRRRAVADKDTALLDAAMALATREKLQLASSPANGHNSRASAVATAAAPAARNKKERATAPFACLPAAEDATLASKERSRARYRECGYTRSDKVSRQCVADKEMGARLCALLVALHEALCDEQENADTRVDEETFRTRAEIVNERFLWPLCCRRGGGGGGGGDDDDNKIEVRAAYGSGEDRLFKPNGCSLEMHAEILKRCASLMDEHHLSEVSAVHLIVLPLHAEMVQWETRRLEAFGYTTQHMREVWRQRVAYAADDAAPLPKRVFEPTSDNVANDVFVPSLEHCTRLFAEKLCVVGARCGATRERTRPYLALLQPEMLHTDSLCHDYYMLRTTPEVHAANLKDFRENAPSVRNLANFKEWKHALATDEFYYARRESGSFQNLSVLPLSFMYTHLRMRPLMPNLPMASARNCVFVQTHYFDIVDVQNAQKYVAHLRCTDLAHASLLCDKSSWLADGNHERLAQLYCALYEQSETRTQPHVFGNRYGALEGALESPLAAVDEFYMRVAAEYAASDMHYSELEMYAWAYMAGSVDQPVVDDGHDAVDEALEQRAIAKFGVHVTKLMINATDRLAHVPFFASVAAKLPLCAVYQKYAHRKLSVFRAPLCDYRENAVHTSLDLFATLLCDLRLPWFAVPVLSATEYYSFIIADELQNATCADADAAKGVWLSTRVQQHSIACRVGKKIRAVMAEKLPHRMREAARLRGLYFHANNTPLLSKLYAWYSENVDDAYGVHLDALRDDGGVARTKLCWRAAFHAQWRACDGTCFIHSNALATCLRSHAIVAKAYCFYPYLDV